MIEPNNIYCMDCFEGMKEIPDKSIDLILTDPPYGIGLDYGLSDYRDSEEEWFVLIKKTLPEMLRVAKMVIMPCCQIKRLKWFYTTFNPDWLICWYKGSVGHRAFVGFNDWEPHLVFGKNDGVQLHDYFFAQPEPFTNGHPCPKPIKWAKWLVSRASKEDDLVLDPFLGSGTTAVACKELGRRYIGFEINPEYFKIAQRRLDNTKRQLKLTLEAGKTEGKVR